MANFKAVLLLFAGDALIDPEKTYADLTPAIIETPDGKFLEIDGSIIIKLLLLSRCIDYDVRRFHGK